MAKKNSDRSYEAFGTNDKAPFTLKIHRGDGMALLAMNWKNGKPPKDFVGFAIEYREPEGDKFYSLKNRIAFPDKKGNVNNVTLSTMLSPIQKFRWVHFPRNAEMDGEFEYKVTPVFMNKYDELSYGEFQSASIALRRETYPGKLNVTFTRGFVMSQAFTDRYESKGKLTTLIPKDSKDGVKFKPTHPSAEEAIPWMGFEAKSAIFEVLDEAYKDKTAKVYVVAFDVSQGEFIDKLVKLGKRLTIIIDDSKAHKEEGSGENQAETKLVKSAGRANVIRQHCSSLQHNKTIVVDGKKVKKAVCGSTNFSWRGFHVQNNNAIILTGAKAIKPFLEAFENYWENGFSKVDFGQTTSTQWHDLGFSDIDAKVTFSPHGEGNYMLQDIADDVSKAKSSVLFSLAFLSQTKGPVSEAVLNAVDNDDIFTYGISDKQAGGLTIALPDGNFQPVFSSNLTDAPEPFKSESDAGSSAFGNRMHHKFIVLDFDTPNARVYMGSYNFSNPADTTNGENLLLIKDKRIVTSYMIEAVRIFDHYHFRVSQRQAKSKRKALMLRKPPAGNEKAWWEEDYRVSIKIKDREIFS
jgi:hypothetical protein